MFLVTNDGRRDNIKRDTVMAVLHQRGVNPSIDGSYTFTSDEGTTVKCIPCKQDSLVWLSGLRDFRNPITNKRIPNPDRGEEDYPHKVGNAVAKALMKEGVSYMRVRHIMKHTLAFGVVNDLPALSLKGKDTKTGKVLRKLLPKGTSDKHIEQFAAEINNLNPSVSRIKAMRDTIIENGLGAAEQGDSVGSCMHGNRLWEKLDEYLPNGTYAPDFSQPPAKAGMAYTVRWPNMTDMDVTSGHKCARAFVWAVETEDGVAWYMDRIYPANGKATSLWAKEWADMVGIKLVNTEYFGNDGGGSYSERADAQPKMFIPLTKRIDLNGQLPWLDTFQRVSEDGMKLQTPNAGKGCGANAHSTSGGWGGSLETPAGRPTLYGAIAVAQWR